MSKGTAPRFFQREPASPTSDSVADEQIKPPPPPPPRAPPPPAPPKPRAPPPPAPPKPQATSPPAPPKPRPKPRKKPSVKPKGKRRRRPAPKKGKPGQPPVGEKKKGRRIRIKLGLRANRISEEVDTYTDQIGWTTSSSEMVLSDYKEEEEIVKKEPDTLIHHCTMCGSRMEIPKPKREKYKVICAHPECGHEDNIGF